MGFLGKWNKIDLLDKSRIAFGVLKVITDGEGNAADIEFVHVNEAMAKLENMTPSRLEGKKFSQLHEQATKSWADMLFPAAYQDKHVERKNYIESLNFLAQIYAFPIEKGMCGVYLKDFTSEIDNLIRGITGKDVCVFYYDIDRDLLIADTAMVEHFGGKTHYQGLINSFALELVDEAYVDVLRSEMGSFPDNNRILETNLKLKSGKFIHFALTADENREERLALGYVEDVTNIPALARAVELDSLTGLFHETAARERIDTAINECMESGRIDALLLIDLDGFGEINEVLGYEKGDEVLKQCAEILRNNFKGKDILARTGGDEYIVYVSDLNDKRAALLICRTLNRILTQALPGKTEDEILRITASIGIAYSADNGRYYEELKKSAQEALKEAKSNGKNGYALA